MFVPDLARADWRKSSRSGNGAHCVEVAPTDRTIAVRDSKDRRGSVLVFDRAGWRAFVRGAKDGTFDR
ncbi:MAG: DUF397 domain-containing protein [Streptosporangiaceae bacterium]